ncbi:hypothetical protein MG293_013881 [Ovis ammon polii]|uniref:GST C-terminal domain-containing protein n=1 Tax=Ovis ammon polii TaxID=230172 RepID=A0AAD4U1Y7_OVIAM|nr:hypothetical protein MG293_013881 [Ovis ammon polii]KAI4557573.1 hypothetical protein MJT46_014252 [Ovis ammon polii x Ovis aries]
MGMKPSRATVTLPAVGRCLPKVHSYQLGLGRSPKVTAGSIRRPPRSSLREVSWDLKQPVDAVQVEQLLGKLTPALGHLDQELLAARPFLAPGQVSLEDLMAFTELMQPAAIGCDLFRDWPRLAAWRARVEAALGPELVQEAHSRMLQPQETQGDPQMAQKLAQQVKEQLR